MAQRYKFSIESKSFPLDISGEPFKRFGLLMYGQKKGAPLSPNLFLLTLNLIP